MQSKREKKIDKIIQKKVKSNTRFPKRMPTYVVAFATKELYDSQGIKSDTTKSPSYNEIAETLSADTFAVNSNQDSRHSGSNLDEIKEIKINIDLDDQKPTDDFLITSEKRKVLKITHKSGLQHFKKHSKYKIARKKNKKCVRTVGKRNIYAKHRSRFMTKKIRKYLDENYKNKQIQNYILSTDVTEVVSRGNMQKQTDRKNESLNDEDKFMMSTYNSFISDQSDSTLVRADSDMSSDPLSDNSVKSVLYNSPTNTVNVAVVVTKLGPKSPLFVNDGLICKESITSTIVPMDSAGTLTSLNPSFTITGYDSTTDKMMLTEMLNRIPPETEITSDSSQSKPSYSNTLRGYSYNTSTTGLCIEPSNSNSFYNVSELDVNDVTGDKITNVLSKHTTCDSEPHAVINLADAVMKPFDKDDTNDVFIGDKITNVLGKNIFNPINESNVLTKTFDINNKNVVQKNITSILPKTEELKALIEEDINKESLPLAQDLKNVCPNNLADMWDKLTMVLDVVLQRLEVSLVNKIVREIKSAAIYGRAADKTNKNNEFKSTDLESDDAKTMVERAINMSMKLRSSKSLQCGFIKNKDLDDLILKMNMDGPKFAIPEPKMSVERKPMEPDLLKQYFEKLSPFVKPKESLCICDTSTSVTDVAETVGESNNNLFVHKSFLIAFRNVLRENIFIIITVPSFIVFVYLMYFVLALIVKIW